jgi:hypothetical protein
MPKMRERGGVLIVTADLEEGRELERAFGLSSGAFVAGPLEASTFLASSLLGGMIVGRGCPAGASRPLVRAYVHHQPCGRIAVLTGPDDITTLTAYSFRESRVELFFAPWSVEEIRAHLGLPAALSA